MTPNARVFEGAPCWDKFFGVPCYSAGVNAKIRVLAKAWSSKPRAIQKNSPPNPPQKPTSEPPRTTPGAYLGGDPVASSCWGENSSPKAARLPFLVFLDILPGRDGWSLPEQATNIVVDSPNQKHVRQQAPLILCMDCSRPGFDDESTAM